MLRNNWSNPGSASSGIGRKRRNTNRSSIIYVNGSLKFWNPDINQWDFLYPEEVKLTVESVFGETSELTVESVFGEVPELTVESVFGEVPELTVESVFGETSELTVEPVFGEVPELNVESVFGEVPELTVKPVSGEVKTPKNYWNCDKGYSGNGWLESHYKIRRGGKQHSINCPEIKCTGLYYSYRWMEGKRQCAKYCPESKCPAVRKALRSGTPISKILEIINQ
jgi:hypothetical protein